ncbi:hypothetical protein Bca4012_030170 [Brassica carinata]
MFPSTKIAIMNVAFQMLWSHQYENWKANESLPGRTFFYYYGLAPRYAETMSHWVAMVICIPDRTVKIYDSGSPVRGNVQLRKAAEAFARMVPFALWFLAEEEHKPSVDRTDFKIKCISKGKQQEQTRVYPQIDGKAAVTVGQFKADDSPVGSMLLPCSVQLGESSVLNWPPVSVPLPSKPQIDGKGTLTGGQFKADDSPAGYMLLPCSVQLGSLAGLKESQKKQRQGDNMFVIYPQIDGKGTATGGQFKADDSPAGYLLLPCYVQLGKLEKL